MRSTVWSQLLSTFIYSTMIRKNRWIVLFWLLLFCFVWGHFMARTVRSRRLGNQIFFRLLLLAELFIRCICSSGLTGAVKFTLGLLNWGSRSVILLWNRQHISPSLALRHSTCMCCAGRGHWLPMGEFLLVLCVVAPLALRKFMC